MDMPNPKPPARSLNSVFGMKFYKIRSLIRKQWWILALTVGLGLAWKGWYLFSQPDLSESTAELAVPEEVNGLEEKRLFRQELYEEYVGLTMRTLQQPELAEAARQRVDLEMPNVVSNVVITPVNVPRTMIFSVSGRGTNPEYTRLFVDAMVEEFISYRKSLRKGAIHETSGDLQGELDGLRKELTGRKSEFQVFVEKHGMAAWKEQAAGANAFLSGLKAQQSQLEHDLLRLQNLKPDQLLLSTQPLNLTSGSPQVTPSGSENSAKPDGGIGGNELYSQYLQLSRLLVQRQADLEERSTIWKPKHPKLKALERDVDDLKRQITVIKKQTSDAMASQVESIKNDLKSLEVSIATTTEKMNEASKKDSEYNRLEGEMARLQKQEDQLVADLRKVEAKTGLDAGLPTIKRHATPPMPVPRGTVKHLLLGLLAGLGTGGVILFLMNRSDDRLTSSTEIIEHFSEPILGQIPDVSDSHDGRGLPLLDPEDERYTYAEAFRSLRSSLIFMPNQSELKSLIVTSAIPNEGKSTVASNLAVTMAASGAKVLLVDADLRRGDIAELFHLDARMGLTNILRSEARWQDVLHTTKYPSLSIITRGPVTNQSGELLLRPALLSILDEFKEAYDLVIFNTAPILATDDTPTLAPNFDGSLMVIRAGFTSAHLTKNALDTLYQRQVNVLGLILNAIDAEMPDYHYYRYPKYYAA